MSEHIVLSHVQTVPLLRARQEGRRVATISLDLGLTQAEVALEKDGVLLNAGQWLPWEDLEEIDRNDSACYVVEDNQAHKIQRFSEYLNRAYSLLPTTGAPTLLVSGIIMHRIKGTDPHRDTLSKIHTIAPFTGRVLDTCTGLGYTAIEAAKTAAEVITVELDPKVLEIARLNPWSRQLFGNPKIHQLVGDSFDEIEAFADGSFARIIHDPPTLSLAGDLYSGEFYRHLYRVLQHRGRLFHYIGDLESRSGRNVVRGVVRRLQEAGFGRIVRKPRAFGVVAYKTQR
jgi:predicted methyltransferase